MTALASSVSRRGYLLVELDSSEWNRRCDGVAEKPYEYLQTQAGWVFVRGPGLDRKSKQGLFLSKSVDKKWGSVIVSLVMPGGVAGRKGPRTRGNP